MLCAFHGWAPIPPSPGSLPWLFLATVTSGWRDLSSQLQPRSYSWADLSLAWGVNLGGPESLFLLTQSSKQNEE